MVKQHIRKIATDLAIGVALVITVSTPIAFVVSGNEILEHRLPLQTVQTFEHESVDPQELARLLGFTIELERHAPTFQQASVSQPQPQPAITSFTQNSEIQLPNNLQHRRVNNDYIGMLSIPRLNINEPLFFTGDDHYLRRNYRGQASAAGELYIDRRSPGDLSRSSNLINGHNMRNGSMFGRLSNLLTMDGPIHIFIRDYETDQTFIYEVFAARLVPADQTGVILSFASFFVRRTYYQIIKENSIIPVTQVDLDNPIITLNTCDDTIPGGHLLVFASLIDVR